MAGTEAACEAIWIKSLTDSLLSLAIAGSAPSLRCELRGDNQGALALAINPVYHQRTKHIHVRHRFICDVVNDGIVTVRYVPTADMLPDALTKPLPQETHRSHCARIGLRLYCKWGSRLLKSRLCFLTSKKHKQDYKHRGTTTWG